MKKIFSFMMMAALLLGSSVFNLSYADSGDCQILVIGYDLYEDGWDGSASVTIQQEGLSDQIFTVTSGNALNVAYIDFLENKDMKFIWKAGSNQDEDALYIFAPDELKVFGSGDLTSAATGDVIYTITSTTCPSETSPITVNGIVLNKDNTVTLSWTLADNSKTEVSYDVVFQKSSGETISQKNISGTTVTMGPLEKDGEYTAYVVAKESGTPFACGSKTENISVNTLGDVNIKIQINDAYGLPDDWHHYLYYRTADDLSIQNSIELTKSGNWWTGTVSAFPAVAMRIRWYATDSEGTIVTDEINFGSSPYTTYSEDQKITLEQNTCFEMLVKGTTPTLVEADCNQTPKERTPKDLTATVTPGKVVFTWSEISEANKYVLSGTTDIMGTLSKTSMENTYTWYPCNTEDFELSQWSVAPFKDSYILVNPTALPTVTDAQQVPANTPYVPQNLTAEFKNETRSIDISWDNVNEAVFYFVQILDATNATVATETAYSNSISVDIKGGAAGLYTIYVQPWYSDKNGNQQMAIGSVTCDVLPTALENVEVSVLIPSDCEFDVSNGVWLYWFDENAALYRVVEAEDKGGRRYNFTFNQPAAYNKVSAFVANEKVDGETLPFTANADRSGNATIYCSSCFELADNGTHSFSISEADCSKNDHDYKPRQLYADYETAGRAVFSWQVKDYAYRYRITYTTDEHGTQYASNLRETGYTLLTDETLHVTQWEVKAYDAKDNLLSTTLKDEKFTIKPSNTSLKASELKVETINGEDYTYSWTKATSTEVASYVLYIEDGYSTYYYKTNDSILTRKAYISGWHSWGVYSIDKDGIRLAKVDGPNFNCHHTEEFTATNVKATLKGNQLTLSWQSNAPVVNVYVSDVIDMYTTKNNVTITITKSGNVTWLLYPTVVDDFGNYSYFIDEMARGSVYVSPQDAAGTVYTLALLTSEGGTVICQGGEGANTYKFLEGDNVNLSTTADKGYIFDHWSDGVTTSSRTVTMTEDLTLKAFFRVAKKCSINISVEPSEGGLVRVNGVNTSSTTVYEGSNLQLEAISNDGYKFKEWRIDGSKESSNETYSRTIKSNTYIVAVFEAASALSSIVAESYSLRQEGMQVVVSTKSDTLMSIYNIAGQLLQQKSGTEVRFTVPATGLYIIRIGDSTEKMIIQ